MLRSHNYCVTSLKNLCGLVLFWFNMLSSIDYGTKTRDQLGKRLRGGHVCLAFFLLLNAPLASSSQQIEGRIAKGITVLLSVDLECLHFSST